MRAALSMLVLPAAACSAPVEPATETIAIRVHEGTTLAFDLSPDGRTIVLDLLGQLWEMPASGGDARPLTDAVRDTAEDLDPSYAPDGRRIVFRGERQGRTGLWLLGPGASPTQLTQVEDPDGYQGEATWSSDGKGITFARVVPSPGATPPFRTGLALLDPATREVRPLELPKEVGPFARDPDWDPAGRRLAVASGLPGTPKGGRLWLIEPEAGRAIPLTSEGSEAFAPIFAPDGRHLAWLGPDSDQRIQVWAMTLDAPGATPLRVTHHDDVARTRVRWTPDGSRVVYSADGRLWKAGLDGSPPEEIPFTVSLSFERARRALPPARFPEPGAARPVRAFMSLALSPDGRQVAMLALGRLWVMPVGGAARPIREVPLMARSLAWSPDGSALTWSAGSWMEEDLFSTTIATGSTRKVTALPGREDHPAWSPDGKHLAFLHAPSEEKTILRVVESAAAELSDPRVGLALDVEPGADVDWTPDSRALLCVTGGFGREGPTKGVLVSLTGQRSDVARMPDSPLFLHLVPGGMVFVRHARLWRAPFEGAAGAGPPEPLGPQPAMFTSVSRDGAILWVSDGGLRLRSPDGSEQRLGWPVTYTPPDGGTLLVRNARLIDGTGSAATPPRDLLVQQGRIRRIDAAGSIDAGTARVLDAGGGFAIPGLMDLHAHVYRPDLLPGYPYFGVTTIRDQGSPISFLVAHADAIAAGTMDGPRVDYGGFQLYSDWAYDTEDGLGVEPEVDADHAARSVAIAQAFGSQHVKTRTFRRWDINARFITEAHRRGMRATGHCAHLLPLVAAGMDAKEHAGFCEPRGDAFIYDDLVQLYRAAGIAVVPTVIYANFAVKMNEHPDLLDGDPELAPFLPPRGDFGWMLGLNPERRAMFAGFGRTARQAAGKLARGGVTIGTGSDIWQIPTGPHMEMEELVAAGLTPLEAIHAATGASARIVGAEQDLGTLEVGKWADLIVLDADPSADIRNTRRIRSVVQAGRVLDREALVTHFRMARNGAGS